MNTIPQLKHNNNNIRSINTYTISSSNKLTLAIAATTTAGTEVTKITIATTKAIITKH